MSSPHFYKNSPFFIFFTFFTFFTLFHPFCTSFLTPHPLSPTLDPPVDFVSPNEPGAPPTVRRPRRSSSCVSPRRPVRISLRRGRWSRRRFLRRWWEEIFGKTKKSRYEILIHKHTMLGKKLRIDKKDSFLAGTKKKSNKSTQKRHNSLIKV